jgi:hypothetical protein
MHRGVNTRKEPVVRDRLDVEDIVPLHQLGFLPLLLDPLPPLLVRVVLGCRTVRPALGDDGKDARLLDCLGDYASHLLGIGDDDGAKADKYDLLGRCLGEVEESEEVGGRLPFLDTRVVGVVEPPVSRDVDVLSPVERRRDDDGTTRGVSNRSGRCGMGLT